MAKCKEKVMSGFHSYGCSRNVWKDGYCKQHHPETVSARLEESQRKWKAKQANTPLAKLHFANLKIDRLEMERASLTGLITALANEFLLVDNTGRFYGHRLADSINKVLGI